MKWRDWVVCAVCSAGTGKSTHSGKAPSAEALLKKRLEAMGSIVRPKTVTIVSPRKSPKTSHDATVTGERGRRRLPSSKSRLHLRKLRKLIVEFLDDYGSAGALPYPLWPEVDRLWLPASRERQEALSPVASTVESVSDV